MTLSSETIIAAISQSIFHSRFLKPTVLPAGEEIFFETKEGPYDLPTFAGYKNKLRGHKVTIILHKALAELLDHHDKEQSGATAIGSALSTQGITVFVASDGNKDLGLIEGHLRRIWASLQELSRAHLTPSANVTVGHELSEKGKMEMGFRRYLYEYSWLRQAQRYDAYSGSDLLRFLEEVVDKSSNSTESSPVDPPVDLTPTEVQACKELHEACRFMERCKSTDSLDNDKDGLEGFVWSMWRLNKLNKGLEENALANLTSAFCKISGLARYDVSTFIKEITFVERSTQDLLRLPYSRHLNPILGGGINVVLVPIQPVLLKFDLLDDPEFRGLVRHIIPDRVFEEKWGKAVSEGRAIWKFEQTVHPHCESALLAYLAVNVPRMPDDTKPYGFIGVSSGLSCDGCARYFGAYNRVAETAGLPKFRLSGSHLDAFHPWAKPEVALEELSEALESKLCVGATSRLYDTLWPTRQALDFDELI